MLYVRACTDLRFKWQVYHVLIQAASRCVSRGKSTILFLCIVEEGASLV